MGFHDSRCQDERRWFPELKVDVSNGDGQCRASIMTALDS